MFALPGIILLIVLILLRPQEFMPALQQVPSLHIALVVAVAGFVIDVLANITKVRTSAVALWGGAFLLWCAVTVLIAGPSDFVGEIQGMLICVTLGVVVAQGVTTPRGLGIIGATMLLCALVLAGVGIHQGLSPKQCLVVQDSGWIPSDGTPSGRQCEDVMGCYVTADPEPGTSFICEHVGIWGTTSIANGRVRYRGVLKDPNELALAIGVALPIAYAMRREHGGIWRTLLAVVATLAVMLCTVFTGSRGGQLVILCVLGVYFVVRTGVKGAMLASLLAIPALVFGGRSGEVASASTQERVECWYAGLSMFFSHPLAGVGHGRFTEHHYLTAHNSYVLTLAELGPLGLWLFVGLLFAVARVPLLALRRYKAANDPRRAWAVALLATMSGLAVGVFFLSFAYNLVLWLFLGLVGAFASVLRQADPKFVIDWRARDTVTTVVASGVIVAAVFGYTRLAL